MSGVAIRRAGPADLPAVLRLLRALAPPGEPAPDLERAARTFCYELVLSSNVRREAAHRFYEDLGFVQHGLSFSVPIARR